MNLSPTVWSAIVVLATMGLTATSLFLVTFGIGMTLSVIIDAAPDVL